MLEDQAEVAFQGKLELELERATKNLRNQLA